MVKQNYAKNEVQTVLPAMLQDAGKVLSQERELAPLINSAVTQYEASGEHSRGLVRVLSTFNLGFLLSLVAVAIS